MSNPEISQSEFKLNPEGVQAFQDRLQDDTFRKNLAAFFAVQRALLPESPFTTQTESGLEEVAWLAVDDYTALTRAANADVWPEDLKTPEEFYKAAEDMDRRDYA